MNTFGMRPSYSSSTTTTTTTTTTATVRQSSVVLRPPPSPAPDCPAFLFSPPILPSSPKRSLSSSSSSSVASSSSSLSFNSESLRRHLLIRELGIDNLIVPKSRRAKFDLKLQIHDLNNVPLVSGHAYIKWHIEGTTRADCRSRTNREPIKEHKVVWGYEHSIQALRLNIGKGSVLQEIYTVLEVHQEYSGGRERILLGVVRLNLAEYAGLEGKTRRYLMQDSKINSTVKIGIEMHQVGGDTNFSTPPLKGAQVFSGIAGIIGEQRDSDDSRKTAVPNIKNRDAGANQDMYRRTLAASWQLIPGELMADECIEDIFAGGDGWTGNGGGGKPKSVRLFEGSDSDSISQISVGTNTPNTTTGPGVEKPAPSPSLLTVEPIRDGKKRGYAVSVMTGRSKLTVHTSGGASGGGAKSVRSVRSSPQEVDELRDDLVSWRMPSRQ